MRNHIWLISIAIAFCACTVLVARSQDVQGSIGNLLLQDRTPGTAQTGHARITGSFRSGRVVVDQSIETTVPIVGNHTATGQGTALAGLFIVAKESGTAIRGLASSTTGSNFGVRGETNSSQGTGVYGSANATNAFGIWARNSASMGPALVAENTASLGFAAKFLGRTETYGAAMVQGAFTLRTSGGSNYFRSISNGFESTFDFFKPGGTASGRIDVDAEESGLSLFSKGSSQVRLLADFNGVGRVTADVKNFVQPDPDDETRDIVYASIEGPEAAAYVRGTALLVNGSAHVTLPRHFQNVSVSEGMTVQLTPKSAESEGLAVVAQSLKSFEVRELRKGKGTYEFAWEVKTVRRGFTDYQVSRPWDESLPSSTDRNQAMSARRTNANHVYGINYSRARP